jgi:hypothetical protein
MDLLRTLPSIFSIRSDSILQKFKVESNRWHHWAILYARTGTDLAEGLTFGESARALAQPALRGSVLGCRFPKYKWSQSELLFIIQFPTSSKVRDIPTRRIISQRTTVRDYHRVGESVDVPCNWVCFTGRLPTRSETIFWSPYKMQETVNWSSPRSR